MMRGFDLLRAIMGYEPSSTPPHLYDSERWLTPTEFWQFMRANGLEGSDSEGVDLARRILTRAHKMGEISGDARQERFWGRPEKRWNPNRHDLI